MAFKPPAEEPDIINLVKILNNAKIQDQNNALYQTIYQLIKRVAKFQGNTIGDLAAINQTLVELSGGGSGSSVAVNSGYPEELGHAKI